MKSVYISSTVEDLKRHRRSVATALANIGYNVEAMEKYPAREDRPKAECEKDAARCDIYVGIIGWRYGYVPEENNPKHKSITQLEYEAASRRPRLVFLSARPRKTPGKKSDRAQVAAFRSIVEKEKWFSTFDSALDLTNKVMTCVVQLDSLKVADSFETLDKINEAAELGPSFLGNIQQQITELAGRDFVTLRLGPTPWWDTRLHLVSALASDFTNIRQFVVLDEQGGFVTMASPGEIRRALAKSHPVFETVYFKALELAKTAYGSEVGGITFSYPDTMRALFPVPPDKAGDMSEPERTVKQVITPASLRELGIKTEGEAVEQFPEEKLPDFYTRAAVDRSKPFVAVMQAGALQGVINRTDLASRMVGILRR